MAEHSFNVKFVGEVEKRPELYNYTLPQYSRKDVAEKGWIEVGKEMNLPASECKERWKNLRSVFVRNLKPPPSGSGSKKKKPYYLMEAMQFALPFVKTNKPAAPGNMPPIHEQCESLIDQDDGDMLENPGPSQQFPAEVLHLSPTQSPQLAPGMDLFQPLSIDTQQSPLSQSPTIQPQASNKTKKKSSSKRGISTTDVDAKFMDFLQVKTARLSTPKEKYNTKTAAIKSFLDLLVPELEPLTNQQLKTFRRRIFQLIDEITQPTPQTTSILSYDFSNSSFSSLSPITLHQMQTPTNNEDRSNSTSESNVSYPQLVSMAIEEERE